MIAKTLILFYCLLAAAPDAGDGIISGTVVNATSGNTPVGGAEVLLRADVRGESSICGETTSDERGRFVFRNLPTGTAYSYAPGANRGGVHFPGPRLLLTAQTPRAQVDLPVYDCISAPSPLVISRQDISMRFQSGVLSVTESIVVDNPSLQCYVGAASQEDAEPITLQLAIPPNFERTTFQSEFFGRRFFLAGDKLVTSIPWLPGRRELKFTYVLPVRDGVYRWQRPLDLPCRQMRISIETSKTEDISCNLAPAQSNAPGEKVYKSAGEMLPKGHVVQVELGRLPVPFMVYARWLAVMLLGSFIAGGSLIIKKRSRAATLRTSPPTNSPKCNALPAKVSRHNHKLQV